MIISFDFSILHIFFSTLDANRSEIETNSLFVIKSNMKLVVNNILIACFVFCSVGLFAQQKISPDDLKMISGNWKGTLTYVDYGTNKPFTMPANVKVEKGTNDFQVGLLISYPKEPNANSKDKIKISKDGSSVNKNPVISRENLPDQEVKIITETGGKDNNQEALIRNIYIFGPERLIIRKEVKFNDAKDWFMRNEYNLER